jgi:hypothetical protein
MKVAGSGGTPVSLLPTSPCAGKPGRADAIGGIQSTGGTLARRMKRDGTVARSLDGRKIAFRGGDCEGVFDDCLTVATVATGAEAAVDAYGGGGEVRGGFAVAPARRPDGARLSWTAYTEDSAPVHVTEATPAGTGRRTVGAPASPRPQVTR